MEPTSTHAAAGLTPEGSGTQGHLQLHSKLEVSQPGLHEIPSENREVQKEAPLAEPGSARKESLTPWWDVCLVTPQPRSWCVGGP